MKPADWRLWDEFKKTVQPMKRLFVGNLPDISDTQKEVSNLGKKRFSHKIRYRIDLPYTLDLHGLTVQEAYKALCRFTDHHFERGTHYIHVITGRGLNVTGAIKKEILLWLDTPFFTHRISSFQWTNCEGALKIDIKKRKKK